MPLANRYGLLCLLVALGGLAFCLSNAARAWAEPGKRVLCKQCGSYACSHSVADAGFAGEWHWERSPEQERRVAVALYNRYCVRCHGVDGRGVWDIPDVPDFTNPRWQACRSDSQIVRLTIEGRGACMPAFRGTISLEETWALTRHLRTFNSARVTTSAKPN